MEAVEAVDLILSGTLTVWRYRDWCKRGLSNSDLARFNYLVRNRIIAVRDGLVRVQDVRAFTSWAHWYCWFSCPPGTRERIGGR